MTREQLELGKTIKEELDKLYEFHEEFSQPNTEIECQRASGYKIRIPATLETEMLKIREGFLQATLDKIKDLEQQLADL